jgi:ABC-type iron transport system FetAB permease component
LTPAEVMAAIDKYGLAWRVVGRLERPRWWVTLVVHALPTVATALAAWGAGVDLVTTARLSALPLVGMALGLALVSTALAALTSAASAIVRQRTDELILCLGSVRASELRAARDRLEAPRG